MAFSNFCGLGGSGIPQHDIDKLCQEHDKDYDKIIKSEGWKAAYLQYNWADKVFIHKVRAKIPESKREAVVKHVSNAYFRLKQKASQGK